ncbi:POT family proton-dependent oligopeptide transporter [Aquimarina sp. EL_43]|uniref:peptide MFS transporter n=1 Tax=Aquimarina TaxID=290174 RepID=UPI00046FFBC4|nr:MULTISPECIES: peptide MFS transporter [Aquimarina]MBG6133629.1 POT family proton-dependent oligopeptide transporter [Aquimarina sp. EL_35]MBG6152398.1 POT family proton-dependent oligopeptide transporter [Aquimarina sp. EL_32]MBG6172002.1 POT family proton-dependent oligopeptide transporter [Aquimarina sp. EL_43]
MTVQDDSNDFSLLGHKPALYVLFFTEMWERFSYYGMRAIFVLFLTSTFADGGWEWSNERALALLGTYTSLVYVTPVIGGWIADKFTGYQKAVTLGALVMTLGHGAMALETETTLYIGVGLLIIGSGLFKPNITSMVSGLYDKFPERKDGAFTIFYMGVNSGGFIGVLLCGFLGENLSWAWGFGLAGIFMMLGMFQFWFGRSIFEGVGVEPSKKIDLSDAIENKIDKVEEKVPAHVQRDRYIVVGILAFFVIFFWASFEQASGSMTIFANNFTQRVLSGGSALLFKIVDTLITIIPLGVITWVLLKLFAQTFKKISLSNIVLGISFLSVWAIALWKLSVILPQETTEIPASWFLILNSLFIITLAPLFSKVWESKYNPSATVKFGLGMILLGIGFGMLAWGSASIPQGAKTASVSLVWLVLAYLLHTMGELCLSPVGLSYVSKLVPAKKIGLMFGLWYLAIAIGNKLAGFVGSYIDVIVNEYSMSAFFLIFTIVPVTVGVILILITSKMKKMMHGVH